MKKFITIFVLAFILPLIMLLIATSGFALNSYQKQSMQSMERMASYFLAETDDALNNIENYLVKNASENYEFGRIAYDAGAEHANTDYQLYKSRFSISLRQNIDLYPSAQYLFFYQTDRHDLLMVTSAGSYGKSSTDYSSMSDYLSHYFAASPTAQGRWTLQQVENEQHLVRIFRFGSAYLGASVPISTLLEKLEKYNLNNCMFRITDTCEEISGVTRSRWLFSDAVISLNSGVGDYSVSLTVDQRSFFTPAMIVFCAILLLSLLMLFLVPVSRRFLNNRFYKPIQILVDHMEKIENGQSTDQLPEKLGGPEMSRVARTFNQMFDQIHCLKIQVYEEKLAQSRLELQCLHLQLNPHFFLNTLNLAYLLVKTRDLENLQSLLKNLTGYFRSIFQCSSETTRLSMELEQCRGYLRIYQIRCFKDIEVIFDVDEDLLDASVPPMCILTFLENSIKYAMEDLNALSIHVSVEKTKCKDRTYIKITVQDNGTGYNQDMLAELNQEFVAQPLTGQHIGIRNLQHRLYYFYKGKASISFANADSGGACTEILLPLDSTHISPGGKENECTSCRR